MNIRELETKYDNYYKSLKGYQIVLSVLNFDNSTIAPKKSLEEKAEYTSSVFESYIKLQTSPEYESIINELYYNKEKLNESYKRISVIDKKDLDHAKAIPLEMQKDYNILINKAFLIWRDAKQNNNWKLFEPYLTKIVEYQRKIASLWGPLNGSLYNTLLDSYEDGNTTEKLDDFFDTIKATIIPLVKKIQAKNLKYDNEFVYSKISHSKQLKIANYLLKTNGFDFTRGYIGETEHPFTDGISPNDARITTHIYENLFLSNIFSVIHEGGHAIYEQNLDDKLIDNLRNAPSMAWHESQSRFYENIIGKSPEYIHLIYKKVNSMLSSKFKNKVTENQLYLAVNDVKASLIRTEADELTYSLHIIIRYELEKRLIEGNLEVKDLPIAWNKLYKEYLGIDVTSDTEGVLQDSHWASGSFGYFPSYALGNAIGAQLLNTMNKEFNVFEAVKENKIKQKIGKWLKNNVYVYGSLYTPKELLVKVTGEELNPKYFTNYLTEKFSKIYHL